MKRSYIALATLAIVFSSINLVWAGSQSGDPFEQIWAALATLEHKIEDIKLIPGPPGP